MDDEAAAEPWARLVRVARTGSTSTELLRAARAEPGDWPHMSAFVADHQDAGRGRSGREWLTPPGAALTASLLLRPLVPPERLGWVTLLAGLAVARAVTGAGSGAPSPEGARSGGPGPPAAAARTVGLKWPNDVVVGSGDPPVPGWGTDRKVAGVLAEVVPSAPVVPGPAGARDGRAAVVVGVGVNIRQRREELPVPWATSLALAGLGAPRPVDLLRVIGHELDTLLTAWEGADGDAEAAGLRRAVRGACVSLGAEVHVELPGGRTVAGTAVDVDEHGHLLVRGPDETLTTVLAGDVHHVRRPPGASRPSM